MQNIKAKIRNKLWKNIFKNKDIIKTNIIENKSSILIENLATRKIYYAIIFEIIQFIKDKVQKQNFYKITIDIINNLFVKEFTILIYIFDNKITNNKEENTKKEKFYSKERKRKNKKKIVEKKNFLRKIDKKNLKKNSKKKFKRIKFKYIIKQKIIIDNKDKEKRIKTKKKTSKIQIKIEFNINIFFEYETSRFKIAIDINCINTIIKFFLEIFALSKKNQL